MDSSNLNYKIASAVEVATNKKYIIEGAEEGENCEYDFFTKLKSMMSSGDTQCVVGGDGVDDSDNICLLTKEPLDDIHIVLNCGHKFNYVPLYKEVVIQKTSAGMTTNGYYNSCLLRTNELKCPYCRRVQDKLLPFLSYENVKKLRGVNAPESLCMKVRVCEYKHKHTETTKKIKNGKKISESCECNATHVVTGGFYCKKHYELQLHAQVVQEASTSTSTTVASDCDENTTMCGVIIKTGKNKGMPCTSSSKCRIHAHLRKNVVVATCID